LEVYAAIASEVPFALLCDDIFLDGEPLVPIARKLESRVLAHGTPLKCFVKGNLVESDRKNKAEREIDRKDRMGGSGNFVPGQNLTSRNKTQAGCVLSGVISSGVLSAS
jgi:hypothetical protein